MKKLSQNLQEAIKVYNAFNKSFYWLEAMVKTGLINEGEAGLIVTYYG